VAGCVADVVGRWDGGGMWWGGWTVAGCVADVVGRLDGGGMWWMWRMWWVGWTVAGCVADVVGWLVGRMCGGMLTDRGTVGRWRDVADVVGGVC
jgi:hypothetical protein